MSVWLANLYYVTKESLITKQGWRLLSTKDSLVAKVFETIL